MSATRRSRTPWTRLRTTSGSSSTTTSCAWSSPPAIPRSPANPRWRSPCASWPGSRPTRSHGCCSPVCRRCKPASHVPRRRSPPPGCRSSRPTRRSGGRVWVRCSAWSTSSSPRGTPPQAAPAGCDRILPTRRCDSVASWSDCSRTSPKRSRSCRSWSSSAPGSPPARRPTANRCYWPIRIAAAGTTGRSHERGGCWHGRTPPRRRGARAAAPTHCRRPSRSATRSRRASTRPTGRASHCCTTCCRAWRRVLWSSSIGRSRCRCRRVPNMRCRSSTAWKRRARCEGRTCCRACAVSSSHDWAGWTRRARNCARRRR
jgi:hypothetical protein